jgi:hypothetical protein
MAKLDDAERATLIQALRRAIAADPFPLSPRVRLHLRSCALLKAQRAAVNAALTIHTHAPTLCEKGGERRDRYYAATVTTA